MYVTFTDREMEQEDRPNVRSLHGSIELFRMG